MTVSVHNRRKLEDAVVGLIDGTAKAADGKLTWKNVAAVAGVSKATADRAVDLRNDFRRRLADQVPTVAIRPKPGSRVRTDVEHELCRLRRDNVTLKEATKVLHSVILALVQDNQRLTRRRLRDSAVPDCNGGASNG